MKSTRTLNLKKNEISAHKFYTGSL